MSNSRNSITAAVFLADLQAQLVLVLETYGQTILSNNYESEVFVTPLFNKFKQVRKQFLDGLSGDRVNISLRNTMREYQESLEVWCAILEDEFVIINDHLEKTGVKPEMYPNVYDMYPEDDFSEDGLVVN